MKASEIIQLILEQTNLNQEQFAQALGMQRPAISRWLHSGGNLTKKTAERINKVFPEYSMKFLLTGDEHFIELPIKDKTEALTTLDFTVANKFIEYLKQENAALRKENAALISTINKMADRERMDAAVAFSQSSPIGLAEQPSMDARQSPDSDPRLCVESPTESQPNQA